MIALSLREITNPVLHHSSMAQSCSAALHDPVVSKADDYRWTLEAPKRSSHRASPLHQHATGTLAIETHRQFSCGCAEQFQNLALVLRSKLCKASSWIEVPCNIIPEQICKAMSKEIMRNGLCNCAHRNLLPIKKH